MTRMRSARAATVAVGLLGLAMAIILVHGVIAFRTFTIGNEKSRSDCTDTNVAPVAATSSGYMLNVGSVTMTSSPSLRYVNAKSCSASSTPFVSKTCSGATRKKRATRRSPASRSGYCEMSVVWSEANLRSTRGEHPPVFSLRSRLSPRRPPEGEWYEGILSIALRGLSIGAPHTDGFGMRSKALRSRQCFDGRRDAAKAFASNFLHGNDF